MPVSIRTPSGIHRCAGWRWKRKLLALTVLLPLTRPLARCMELKYYSGILIRDTSVKDLSSRIKRERNNTAVVSVQSRDNGFNRSVLNHKGVHILRGLNSADKNAFDHVAAKIAADNRVAIDLDLSPLISGRGFTRQRVMHRYRDILVLQRRYEFPLTISSHSRSILDMRAVREIAGLCSLIGMDIPDVERAFFGVDIITTPPNPAVKVIL